MKVLKNWLLLTAIGFLLAAVLPHGGQLEPKESKRQWDAKSIIIKELSPFDEIPRMFKMKETGGNCRQHIAANVRDQEKTAV